jgi:translation initiation factor IF-2
MGNVRVFQLARELGLSSHDVIEHLRRLGVEAKTASSSVDEDTSDKLKRTLKIDALTARRRRYYGSEEDEAQRENEAQVLAEKIAAERAERERAAEEARAAAEERKARRGRGRRADRQAERAARTPEASEPAPALDHPPGAPRLAPRIAPAPQEPIEEELPEAEPVEEAPSPTTVAPPAEPAAAPAPQSPAPEPPAPVVRQVTRVRGPVRPIAPVPPPPAAEAAGPATEPEAIEAAAPPPPPPSPPPAAAARPALRRPLRPIAPPRPAGPHPTSPHAVRPQVSPGSTAVPRSPHAVTPRRGAPGGLRPTSPIPRRTPPAPEPFRPSGRGAKRRKAREAIVTPSRDERPSYSGPLRKISLSEGVTVKELAEKMPDIKSRDIMKLLISRGVMVTVNQPIDPSLATEISKEFGYEATIQSFEEEVVQEQAAESKPEDLLPRWPVVTVMGHVDHGKTSLLDAIRETRVVDDEAGGITQHIGAYQVDVGGRKVVFLDTPGHEAFTLMRARGARVTDVVVLVVAADDGVMPQTLEAIDHAKAASVPLLVAVNKIDKPGAQPDRVRQQLSDRGLMPEAWGGSTVFVDVSAKKRQNLSELLEMVLLVSDLQELKANPAQPAVGTVLEARLDKGRGPVATVLIQDGTLRVGDTVVAGAVAGKVRALVDDKGRRQQEAGPATPVEVLGLTAPPEPGDQLLATDAAKAQSIVGFRQLKLRERAMAASSRIRLEDLGRAIAEGQIKELPLVIKADVQGSVEAVSDQLTKLPQDKIKLRIIRSGAGAISEGDVLLAAASDAVVIGFNVRPERKASVAAERDQVEVRLYTVIYDAIQDMKNAMEGLLEPTVREVTLGAAEVRETFKISKVGTIAGSYVSEGRVTRSADVRLLRDNVVIHTGKVASLRRFKDDANEVKAGLECGIGIAGYNDVKPGDVIEFFTTERVKDTLD